MWTTSSARVAASEAMGSYDVGTYHVWGVDGRIQGIGYFRTQPAHGTRSKTSCSVEFSLQLKEQARIAAVRFESGLVQDPAEVDANYVRRSDAEMMWRDKV